MPGLVHADRPLYIQHADVNHVNTHNAFDKYGINAGRASKMSVQRCAMACLVGIQHTRDAGRMLF